MVDSLQYAKTQATPVSKLQPNEFGGEIRVAYAKWDSDNGALGNGDTVNLFRLPKGSRVLAVGAVFEAFGSSVVLDVGTGGTADLFAADVDVSTAGSYHEASDSLEALSDDTLLIATLSGADPADNADLEVFVYYVKT
ncbi:MAG: hypothetical protein GVY32_04150 [Gammaproteobacteria bacterium]|jgi:hypothetical protein|nr:hypothetical protein [Gammaproteobacteria bacterium]